MKTGYAYCVTGSDGSMAHRVKPGEIIIERKYMGRYHDWNVLNLKTGEDTGGFTGTFLCKVELQNDRLTVESKLRIKAKTAALPEDKKTI